MVPSVYFFVKKVNQENNNTVAEMQESLPLNQGNIYQQMTEYYLEYYTNSPIFIQYDNYDQNMSFTFVQPEYMIRNDKDGIQVIYTLSEEAETAFMCPIPVTNSLSKIGGLGVMLVFVSSFLKSIHERMFMIEMKEICFNEMRVFRDLKWHLKLKALFDEKYKLTEEEKEQIMGKFTYNKFYEVLLKLK